MKKNKSIYSSTLTKDFIGTLSEQKQEPSWMRDIRLQALDYFLSSSLPSWGPDLSGLHFDDICYYLSPPVIKQKTWDDVPDTIKNTFDRLGVPEAEKEMLAGLGAQFESELVYKRLKDEWREQGVVFTDISEALHTHEDLVKRYFSTIVPFNDNVFAALNTAVWSGGSFVYIPAEVKVSLPLQAYFRIDKERMGQFERTLIIAEPDSFVHYVEGCSAPVYTTNALHSAVVEIAVLPSAHVRYSTIQNWAPNVYNLVTKRAVAMRNATMEWVDGNFGSKVTMKYPSIILQEPGARGEIISIAVATGVQEQDSGGKVIHMASDTTSTIIAKSISKDGGVSTYRGLVKIVKGACRVRSRVTCDALLLDDRSISQTLPVIEVREPSSCVEHEASVGRITDEQLFYLMSRGFTQQQAYAFMVNGFIDAFVQLLPMEYAIEINRLIELEMEGSVG